jgi:hypothetical protein
MKIDSYSIRDVLRKNEVHILDKRREQSLIMLCICYGRMEFKLQHACKLE